MARHKSKVYHNPSGWRYSQVRNVARAPGSGTLPDRRRDPSLPRPAPRPVHRLREHVHLVIMRAVREHRALLDQCGREARGSAPRYSPTANPARDPRQIHVARLQRRLRRFRARHLRRRRHHRDHAADLALQLLDDLDAVRSLLDQDPHRQPRPPLPADRVIARIASFVADSPSGHAGARAGTGRRPSAPIARRPRSRWGAVLERRVPRLDHRREPGSCSMPSSSSQLFGKNRQPARFRIAPPARQGAAGAARRRGAHPAHGHAAHARPGRPAPASAARRVRARVAGHANGCAGSYSSGRQSTSQSPAPAHAQRGRARRAAAG